MTSNVFRILIQTPNETILDTSEVVSVVTTAIDGLLTILPNHMALATRLEVSILEVELETGTKNRYVINGGLLAFRNNVLFINTIEAQLITGKNPDLELFPQALQAKNTEVQVQIDDALKAGGYYEPDQLASSLLAEEHLAKFEVLKELLKGV